MRTRLYPEGKLIHGRWSLSGFGVGVLTAINKAKAFLYGIDPTLKQFYGGGMVNVIRARFTAAEVNAGQALLAAKPGLKYKMVDAIMIAIGGNAATVTTVDILATQAAGSVKLVAASQAGLTQSTVVRAGDASGAVLADGDSFVANDANTGITIDITGSDLATATHIDFIFTYVVEE